MTDRDRVEAALAAYWDAPADIEGVLQRTINDGKIIVEQKQRIADLTRERDDLAVRIDGAEVERDEWRLRRQAAEARLARAREALERIAASRADDIDTLHPGACALVAAETLRALDSEPAGRDQEAQQ